MGHIQSNAESAVRSLLMEVGATATKRTGKSQLNAVDTMDDGTAIQLTVDIDANNGSAVFDFDGTDMQVILID